MLTGARSHPALAPYDVTQEITSDGGHTTLLARRKNGESLVTIKILVHAAIPDDIAPLLSKEASLAARLAHDTVMQTRALLLEKNFAAVVTEFLPGVSLQRLLRFASSRGVRLPDEAAWYIAERVFAALAYAHGFRENGTAIPILHRDVSPAAVVVAWDGTTKLGDFGLSRLRTLVAPLAVELELPTQLVAPEQARGATVDQRSDVFSAGLLALRLATGRTPYARFGDSAAQMMIAMSEANVTPVSKTRPDLPEALRTAIDLALVSDPDKRTITARELHDIVATSFDVRRGKEALAKLIARWRSELEKTVAPWERPASSHDSTGAAVASKDDGALALAIADERPSSSALVTTGAEDEPWKKGGPIPKEETALAATDPITSMSRVGAVAVEALSMPLPPMRITMPSLPVYDGGQSDPPPPPPAKRPFFSGRVGALSILVALVVLAAVGYFVLQSLAAH